MEVWYSSHTMSEFGSKHYNDGTNNRSHFFSFELLVPKIRIAPAHGGWVGGVYAPIESPLPTAHLDK